MSIVEKFPEMAQSCVLADTQFTGTSPCIGGTGRPTETLSERLITFKLVYPRLIHSQLMTYRWMARNTASSRAVPIERSLKYSKFVPPVLTRASRGMGGADECMYLDEPTHLEARLLIEEHASVTRELARRLDDLGVHKQHINRYLEPFQYVHAIFTGTEQTWRHVIAQRTAASEVQPEMYALGLTIERLLAESSPISSRYHVPGYNEEARELAARGAPVGKLLLKSAAKAFKVSYAREDEEPSDEFLFRLGDLFGAGHTSPLEHACAIRRMEEVPRRLLHSRQGAWPYAWVTLHEALKMDGGYLAPKGVAEVFGRKKSKEEVIRLLKTLDG